MKRLSLAVLLTSVFVLSSPVTYGDMQMDHHNSISAATKAYMRAMDKMHKPMMKGVEHSNPDIAFVKGMIAHHKGAVEMAKIELKYGKDPELRKLAEAIIRAQNTELRFMRAWLKKNNK